MRASGFEWCGTSPHRAVRLIQPAPTPEQREEIEEARTKQDACGEYLRLTLQDGRAELRVLKADLAGMVSIRLRPQARGNVDDVLQNRRSK